MSDINRYCPRCGGLITYNTDDEGRLIKWCSCCRAYYIVGNNVNTQEELTTAINQHKQSLYFDNDSTYSIINRIPETLIINCDSITLKNNNISIVITKNEQDIRQFDSITINGVKFKKVREHNDN